MPSRAGSILIALLLAIAGLHLYWGLGGLWPGHDVNSLRETVIGTARGPMPGLAASAMVAGALAAAALIVWARHSPLMTGPLRWLIMAGYIVLILVFARAGWRAISRPCSSTRRGGRSSALNLWLYAPLCLALAALFILSFPRGGARRSPWAPRPRAPSAAPPRPPLA